MRRSRIQVKPLLSARPTRPTSDNNVASQEASSRKENESLPKSVEGAIVSSVPATAGTNSSTSSVPKLNVRRPAFSVRPRPSIRGLGVPNLHGTEPTPILVAPSSQQKEAFSSGDGAESVVKKLEDPVSVAVPLDIKEKSVAEVNREDSTKNISEKKDDSVCIPRRSKFPVQPTINVKGRIGLSSRLTAVDIQPDSVKISHVECTNREDQSEVKEDDQPDAKKKTEFEENTETSVKTTSNVEATILPRLSRFPIQPRSDAKDVSQSSTAPIFSITKTDINPSTSPSVTPQDAPSAIIKDTTTSKTDDSKRNSNNKDLTAISKGMTIKSERTSLPKRSRFVAQFKLNAEMTSQSSASPPTPAIPSPTPAIPSPTPAIPSPTPAIPSPTPAIPSATPAIPSPTPAFTSSSKTSVENPSAVISNEINISEMNKKTNSKMKEDNHETFAVVSKESDTIKTKTTILSESDDFEIPSKTKADAEDRSSTSSTKPTVSKFTESESTSISTEATNTLASDDNKLKDNSQINVTNKNDDASTATTTTTDKESITQPAKDIPVLSRRMRFPIRPKLAPQSKDELQSTSIVEKTSEETLKTSNEMISVVKTSVLSRRSRFQIQPKPSGKTSKQSSSAPVNNMKMSSSSPSLSDNELTPKSSQGDTPSPETEESKPKEESGNNLANKEDMEDTAKELPSKSEMTSLPTLSRRSRFQVQPKVRNSQSKDKQPDVPANEDKAKISNESTNKRKTTILSESDHFEIPSKTKADAEDRSSTSSTKPTVSKFTESESTSISTEATSTLASDDNKLKDNSQINVTNKNDDDDDASTATTTTTDRESTTQPAKTSVLPRRNRFQIQPKPSAKTSKQSPSSQSSSSPPLSDNGLTPNSSQDDTPTPEVNKGDTEDTATELLSKSEPTSLPSLSRRSRFQVQPKVRNSQSKDKQPDVPVNEEKEKILNDGTSKSEAAILPRRNRFQVQPKPGAKSTEPSSSVAASTKVGTNQSVTKEDIPLASVEMVTSDSGNKQTVNSQKNDDANSTDAALKIEATILPRRNRFQVQPKPGAKSTEPSSSVAASTKVGTNQSVTKKDVHLTSVETVTSDSGNKQTVDFQNNDGDTTSTDAAPKIEKPPAPTVSRRSRFQVRPKLGIFKDLPKTPPSNPKEAKEKRVEKTPSKSATSIVSLNTSAKNDQQNKEDGLAASPQKNTTQDERISSESPKSSEKSSADSSVQTPVKLSGKNSSSLSSPLKDNIQIENIKQREYPVNVHKASSKSSKSLPLREKQKKPDVSVHPSDKPPDKGKMRMRDLIYWNPSSNPMKSPHAKRARPVRQSEESPTKPVEPTSDENEPIAVPQVKIGADGNIVLNEESLVINNSQPTAPVTMEVVDETDAYSNYGSFRRYTPKSKWSLKETKKFFLALSSVGTDFSLMTNLFTKKSRRDLKNKFKREERNNRWLVDKAIQQQLHFDEKLFEEMSESEEEDVEPPTKKSRQKKDPSESLKKKERKSGKSKKDSTTANKSKQKVIETEEGEVEPPAKKSRTKKDSSKNLKTKEKKSKAPKTDAASTAKKTKKSKHMTHKDWVIASQEEETPGMSEEIVEEEPVMNEMLIIPESTPYAEDTLTRTKPKVPGSQSQEEEEVVNILIEMGQNGGLDSRAQQRSQVPSSVRQNKHLATLMPTVKTHSTPTPTAVPSNKPGVSNRGKSIRKVPQDVSKPGSSSSSHVAAGAVATTSEDAQDNGSLARLFLQQMGLNSQLNALQDEIVSITEAEISNNDQIQKVILVEVQPKDQKQTVVHMYLVSRTDGSQPCTDGSAGGQVTVSAAQPLALPPSMSSLSDTSSTPNLTDRPSTPNRTDRPSTPNRTDRPSTPNRTDRPSTPNRTDRPSTPNRTDAPSTPNRTDAPSTPNRTDAPSTPNRTDAPSTPNRTDAPSTPNRTDAPSTPNRTDAPSTPNRTDAPSTPNRTDAPSTPNRTDAPSTPNRTDAPSTPNRTDAPSTPNRTDAPSTPNRTDAPSTPNRTDAPSTPNRTDAPSTPNRTDAPSTPNRTDAPSTPNRTDAPSTPNRTDAPSTPNRTDAPSTPNRTDAPSTPNRTDAPSTPNRTDAPSTPNRTDAPSTPNRTDAPSTPNRTDAPSTPNRTDAPSTPNRTDAPSTPNRTDAPSTPNRTDAPSTPNRTDRPSTPNRTDRPSTPNRTDRPSTPNRTDRPSTPNRTDRPSTPNRTDRPSTPNRTDAPSTPNRTDAPFIDPSMTNVTEAPTPDTAASMSS